MRFLIAFKVRCNHDEPGRRYNISMADHADHAARMMDLAANIAITVASNVGTL